MSACCRRTNCVQQLSIDFGVEAATAHFSLPLDVVQTILISQCGKLLSLSVFPSAAGLEGAGIGILAALRQLTHLEVMHSTAGQALSCLASGLPAHS